ncbi:MAG: AAA family ATPase [Solirubrobacterales bacterium]
MSRDPRLWIAVTGKGGAGKSVIAGTLARILARRGHRVLALDSDPMPGLTLSLGAEEPAEPPLNQAAENYEGFRWRLKSGIGPVRAIQRFSTEAPDGVRLLTLGKADRDGLSNIQGSVLAYHDAVNRLDRAKTFRNWALIGDVPAGPRQVGAGFAAFARRYLVVVEPTWPSALAGRRVARVARAFLPGADVRFVASKVRGAADRRRVELLIGKPVMASIPLDPEVAAAERRGVALLDAAPDALAVHAIERLADDLEGRRLSPHMNLGSSEE